MDNIINGIKHEATEEEKKLDDEVLEHKQKLVQQAIEKALSQGEAEQVMRDAKYANDLAALKDNYAEELSVVGDNEELIA